MIGSGIKDVNGRNSLVCSKFRIMRGGSREKSRTTTLDLGVVDPSPQPRRAEFNIFRDLLGRVPWDTILKMRGVEDSLLDIQRSPPPSS